LFANLALIGIIYGLEKIWLIRHEASKLVIYEKIEFIKPEKRAELLADLEIRTGHKINHIEIGTIDFMKDIAHITIFYYEDENRVPSNYLGTDRDDGD
jgi:hypothetical protein